MEDEVFLTFAQPCLYRCLRIASTAILAGGPISTKPISHTGHSQTIVSPTLLCRTSTADLCALTQRCFRPPFWRSPILTSILEVTQNCQNRDFRRTSCFNGIQETEISIQQFLLLEAFENSKCSLKPKKNRNSFFK